MAPRHERKSRFEEGQVSQSAWIVIPALNEAKTIGGIVVACRAYGRGPIVVDDGSSD